MNYYTKKKQELLNVGKNYKFGIVDGLILSIESAVNVLINHTNIRYIQFSNTAELESCEDLTTAIENGVDYELSKRYYID